MSDMFEDLTKDERAAVALECVIRLEKAGRMKEVLEILSKSKPKPEPEQKLDNQ